MRKANIDIETSSTVSDVTLIDVSADPTNEQRALAAQGALSTHANMKGDVDWGSDENVTDLLADLMHYCTQENINFTAALESAQSHFEAEKEEQSK